MTTSLKVTSPYDGSLLEEIPFSDGTVIEQALETAYGCYRNRQAWIPLHERVAILERLTQLMTERCDALALQAAREGGKPLVDSIVEAKRAADGIKLAIETIRTEAGEVVPINGTPAGAQRVAFTQKEPIGVVVAVSAFNHPLNLIVHQVAAAVAAGCPVIVKPAEDTPISCKAFVEMLHEAGLPKPWCQFVLPESLQLAERLVTDQRVGFFSFIGSAKVGWMLRSKLAPGTRCALEHGGVAPLILAEDADIDKALASVLKAGFYHAGQVCVSVQRVLAEGSIAEEFSQRLAQLADGLKVGDPASLETEVGPLIRPAEMERVASWVDEAVTEGGQRLNDGGRLDNNCYSPTVIYNPSHSSKVSQQEIFGPVVCVYQSDSLESALQQANGLPYAFQAAVFTRDIDKAMMVYRNIDASAVMVNDHTAFRVDGMPFAGLRQSGLGVGGIPHTIRDMQIEKMLVLNSAQL
ncbi:MAG: aldehyde dehydrogenase family protein [Candidatus Thiodiazotropha lotti]|uniref:Aldehyde dehydrogenase n=1 Tax=Candidatus Thiodiazotropha endoloripes TaxID=1818881 RepID=A0A1E2UID1_9GAMM|nr:aldehyde dehydrogenase family protein [Candidatus Thiodiazotropha endoloripes]MCG7873069.1 aldehyde dehydrogenase family protein [Candidatus Thiodiazotropha lotti]MCG7898937.1 aldehyde dehydrogenase family protein [Candidatus Thiodiazotropha weberae]MCG7902507.1 aldehyde dehydrogenase family protein [Candidatus Thiodiazotropha weberae]MCG7913542.1 aldehyde dehydrogenase family protein [Candidatus Thiodiazotropha weberae]MCG7993100.1 aldehyde dehydrogenase family protein [Candidatus Thiodiaz